jgi:DNA-binding transcriptional MerR regulator
MATYRIAEAADLIGVPATTLRYYEDAGVVSRPSRGDNGYRSYSERDIDRLRFVARAKQLNLGVGDLRELVDVWETDDCSSVQHRMAEVVATRLTEAQRQVADLVELAAQLQTVAARLAGTPAAGPCGDDCPCVSSAPVDVSTAVPLTRTLPVHDDSASVAAACSLEADLVQGRIADWQRIVARAIARTAVDGGVALRFPADGETAAELARLAAAEQQCCTFFDFRLHLAGPVITFEVRAPADARDVVAAMFGVPA